MCIIFMTTTGGSTMRKLTLLLALAAMGLSACGSGGVAEVTAPSVAPTTGLVNIGITDAPIDSAHKVCVVFDSAEFKHSDDSVDNTLIEFVTPVSMDLLSLQGTNSAGLIVGAEMPAGQYNWVRLGVIAGRGLPTVQDADPLGTDCVAEGSYIVLDDGIVHNLYVPSGDQAGLKLNRGFFLPAGGSADFTIDFDLRKSVAAPRGSVPDFRLRPTLRMVDNGASGTLSGSVDATLATAEGCTPVVYVYEGDRTPDDIDGDDSDPVSSATVTTDDGGANWRYTVGFLPAGPYKAAFTCDADDAEAEDSLLFVPAAGTAFTVTAGTVTTVDFAP